MWNTNNMILNEIANTRVLLHERIYNNPEIMNDLISDLNNNFSLFTIEYDIDRKFIQLKIKKTNMKKIDGNIVNYYYSVLNAIFIQFFIRKYNIIAEVMMEEKMNYNLSGKEIELLSNPNIISNFYNITLISDNIITIHL